MFRNLNLHVRTSIILLGFAVSVILSVFILRFHPMIFVYFIIACILVIIYNTIYTTLKIHDGDDFDDYP